MQVGFAWRDTRLDTAVRQLMGLSSLEIISIAGRRYLIAAGEADGGLSSYEIAADGALTSADDVLFSQHSGTQNVRYVGTYMFEGEAYVVPAGRYDDNLTIYKMDQSGEMTAHQLMSGAETAQLTMSELVTVGSESYLFSANTQAGLDRFSISPGGFLANHTFINDTATTALGDVSSMTSALLKGHNFLFVASAFDAGLSVFQVGAGGALSNRYHFTPEMAGFNAISALATAEVGPRSFVLAASAETDTLMVLRVSAGGRLKLIDRVIDTSETRMARVSSVETFEYEGRTFVLAAGSDDGLTLFELNYRGRLKLLGTVADQFTTTLDNISDIEVSILEGKILVFVSSGSEHGFTEFELTLNPGDIYYGGATPDIIIGSAGDDTIYGMGRNDIIDGGAGNDRLIDGRGRDELTGGSGADIFEFIADGRRDRIMDFEQGIDRLDFGDYDRLYSYLDLDIRSSAYGAVIYIGEEKLQVYAADGLPIDVSSWVQDDFIFG